jgi:hypothetical protein
MSKRKTRRSRPRPQKRGGVMLGMRSGFRSMSGAVTRTETAGSSKWVGRVVMALLILAAGGLLLLRFL